MVAVVVAVVMQEVTSLLHRSMGSRLSVLSALAPIAAKASWVQPGSVSKPSLHLKEEKEMKKDVTSIENEVLAKDDRSDAKVDEQAAAEVKAFDKLDSNVAQLSAKAEELGKEAGKDGASDEAKNAAAAAQKAYEEADANALATEAKAGQDADDEDEDEDREDRWASFMEENDAGRAGEEDEEADGDERRKGEDDEDEKDDEDEEDDEDDEL